MKGRVYTREEAIEALLDCFDAPDPDWPVTLLAVAVFLGLGIIALLAI